MITLSDEILNKYLDGELSREVMDEIEETIKNSREDRIRLITLKDIHNALKDIKVTEIKSNFTSLVMREIHKSLRSKQDQKNFIIAVISVFMLMCFIIVGFIGFELFRNITSDAPTALRNSIKYVTSASEFITNIFNSRNMSIIGAVFSFGLIISAWLFFDYNKILRKAGK